MKSERFLAVEIGDVGLALAEFSLDTSGQIELFSWKYSDFKSAGDSDLSHDAIVAVTLKEQLSFIAKPIGKIIVALPGQSILSRRICMPLPTDKVSEQTVLENALKHIPIPVDDLVWDYQRMGSEVLLVAIKAELAESMFFAVEAAGLTADVLDLAPAALANTFRHTFPNENGSVLILNCHAQNTNLVFLDGSRTIFRTVTVAVTRRALLVDEIRRSITFYIHQQQGVVPEQIFISGATEEINESMVWFSEQLECSVEILNPLQGIQHSPQLSIREPHRLSVLVGLALRGANNASIEVNLIPSVIRNQRRFRKRLPLRLACAALLILQISIWAASLAVLAERVEEEAAQVNMRVVRLEAIEARLFAVEQRVAEQQNRGAVYTEILEQRSFWITSLMDVHDLLPEGMFLSGIEPLPTEARADGMRMTLISYLDKELVEDSVVVFRDNLRSSKRFSIHSEIVSRARKKKFARSFVLDAVFETPGIP